MDAALLLCPDLALRLPDTTERSMADACTVKITVTLLKSRISYFKDFRRLQNEDQI